MTKKSYTATTAIPRVAAEGETVELTERQARYHLLSGNLVEADKKPAVKQPVKTANTSDKTPEKTPEKTSDKKSTGKKD